MNMRQIASIEIFSVLRELKAAQGLYLKKFYDLGNDSFRMSFSSSSASISIYVRLLQTINKTEFVERADEPTQFAVALRKRILGRRLRSISQHGTDRIIVLDFEGEEGYRLIFEMFAKGNVVFVGGTGTVSLAYRSARQRERSVVTKGSYSFPSSDSRGFEELDIDSISGLVKSALSGDSRLISSLSQKIEIGPLYLEDAILRCGLDPKAKAGQSAPGGLAENIFKIIQDAKNPSPRIYTDAEKVVDYAIVPIKKYEQYRSEEKESVSGMLDEFYMGERKRLDRDDSEIVEISSNIQTQKKLEEGLLTAEKEYSASANRIFENMDYLNSIIDYINEKRRVTLEELQAKFSTKVKSVDLKKKSFVVELE